MDPSDLFFRFPDTEAADAGFAKSVLNLVSVAVMGSDSSMHVQVINLQGEEMLLRLGKAAGGSAAKPRLPRQLRKAAGACLRTGRTQLLRNVVLEGTDGDRCDLLVCPGEIGGGPLAFTALLPSSWESDVDADSAFDRLLDSFDGVVVMLDRELRFQRYNTGYLKAFDLEDGEVRGRRFSERSSSEQAKVMEKQILYNMEACQVSRGELTHMTTTRHGVVFASVWSWPFYDTKGMCQGAVGVMRPLPADVPSPLIDEAKERLFGKTTVRIGPPMFFTHLDGKIVVMNAAAQALVGARRESDQADLRTAISWRRPEIIDKLYQDIIGGSPYSAVLTEVAAPSGDRICRVDAIGLKEVGDITSEVLVHVQDMTESERVRALLADTARSLSVEKEILARAVATIDLTFTIVDQDLSIRRANEAAGKKFGVAGHDLIGRKIEDLSPFVREAGLIAHIKTAMEHGKDIHVPRFIHTTRTGDKVPLALSILPVNIDDSPACIVITRDLKPVEDLESEFARKSDLYGRLFSSVQDGVAIIDRQGILVDINPALEQAAGRTKDSIIGRRVREIADEIILPEHRDLVLDYMRKAQISRRPVQTGCIKLTNKESGIDMFVDMAIYPLLSADGSLEELAVVVHILTERMNLEKQVTEYTENLEALVSERTRELSSANAMLEGTLGKVASLAKSGMVLSSLKDTESVIDSFMVQAREVLGADFVSVALVGGKTGAARTTYYSCGDAPPPGEIPSEIVEKALAHLMLYGFVDEKLEQPLRNLLTVDFAFSEFRGLLLAWKREGDFGPVDSNLSRLLCTRLGFALPITTYVSQLRTERDRSHAMRRIAFRVATVGSVGSGISIVAEEVSRVIPADRFFWLVLVSESDAWIREIYRAGGAAKKGPRHIVSADSEGLRSAFKAGHDSHQAFCERFPAFGRGDFVPEDPSVKGGHCPFVSSHVSRRISGYLKDMLDRSGLLGRDEGSFAAAPVALSHDSWGVLCAYREGGGPFSPEDTCFMCLAASTVGHMWQAVDSAGNVRRLEAAGETVSELAHDLKYPLMRIKDCIASLAGSDEGATDTDPRIASMAREIDSLARLAQELIDISRPVSGKAELVDMNEIVDYCLSLTAGDAAARTVSISKQVTSGLPPVLASRKDVKTVLLNVLANCIDAAGEGGRVDLRVGTDRSPSGGERLCVTLHDTGPGVGLDDLDRIFEPFYSTKDGGSGLGLFSAKKRAVVNGGDVECELGEDGRSRFVIWFPVASD